MNTFFFDFLSLDITAFKQDASQVKIINFIFSKDARKYILQSNFKNYTRKHRSGKPKADAWIILW
jgi:hypothetical protein